jgi:hypothetical protein
LAVEDHLRAKIPVRSAVHESPGKSADMSRVWESIVIKNFSQKGLRFLRVKTE